MLYQRLRKRSFKIVRGPIASFPCDAVVLFKLLPPWPFGTKNGDGLSRTASSTPRNGRRHGQLRANRHRGRTWCESETPLTPLQLNVTIEGVELTLNGDVLITKLRTESPAQLERAISRLYYWLPVFLNLDFGDPPAVEAVSVICNGSQAAWVVNPATGTIFMTDQERQQELVREALVLCLDDSKTLVVRLLTALEYFYAASRLITLGETPGEFLSEAVLNFAKILEALFPGDPTADAARKGLKGLGYKDEEIEWNFIRAIYLRNSLGVGHARLSALSPDDLQVVHEYADSAEGYFRELVKRVMALAKEERDFLQHETDASSMKDLQRLVSTMKERRTAKNEPYKSVTITDPPPPIPIRPRY